MPSAPARRCAAPIPISSRAARPVALGALIVFGDAAAAFAARTGLALEGIERTPLDMWRPAECPLCGAGIAVETVFAGG
jgi:orotate phosphoribosyltransferase